MLRKHSIILYFSSTSDLYYIILQRKGDTDYFNNSNNDFYNVRLQNKNNNVN